MQTYNPSNYSFEDAAHLMRRAGFGGTPEQIEALQRLGPWQAVEQLLTWNNRDNTQANPFDVAKSLENAANNNVGPGIRAAQSGWLYKMIYTTQPLKEKMTLFWHGHFVTGLDKVRQPYDLEQQNEVFRTMGQGNFEALTLAVAKDPAMLRYLDNAENVKGHPNENFARELMELFTMGVGNYTEKDIQEAARALTGWMFTKTKRTEGPSRFVFNQKQHDAGEKTVFGKTGKWQGQDIVGFCANHEATAKFMSKKFWTFFVSETLPDTTHEELAALWRKQNGNIREFLRVLLTSEAFYAPRHRQALIKGPIEYAVGVLRAGNSKPEAGHIFNLVGLLSGMYQTPYDPPDVSGWDAGEGWISDTSLLNRLGFVAAVAFGGLRGPKQLPTNGPLELGLPRTNNTAQTIEMLSKQFLGRNADAQLRQTLERFAANRNDAGITKQLLYLVLASPAHHMS